MCSDFPERLMSLAAALRAQTANAIRDVCGTKALKALLHVNQCRSSAFDKDTQFIRLKLFIHYDKIDFRAANNICFTEIKNILRFQRV